MYPDMDVVPHSLQSWFVRLGLWSGIYDIAIVGENVLIVRFRFWTVSPRHVLVDDVYNESSFHEWVSPSTHTHQVHYQNHDTCILHDVSRSF